MRRHAVIPIPALSQLLATMGLAAFALLAISFMVAPALAQQWGQDGAPICTAANDQIGVKVVNDGANGMYVLWADMRSGSWALYLKRIGPDGSAALNEVQISAALRAPTTGHTDYDMVLDPNNNPIIVWSKPSSGTNQDLFAQRVDGSNGTLTWQTGPIVSQTGDDIAPSITWMPTSNRLMVAFESSGHIYCQQVDAYGYAYGQPVQASTQIAHDPVICGSLDPIVAYRVEVAGSTRCKYFAQRVSSGSGATVWQQEVTVGVAGSNQNENGLSMVSDGSGGVYCAWTLSTFDAYNNVTTSEVYCARLTDGATNPPTGTVPWGSKNGTSISAYDHRVVAGDVGPIFVWSDLGGITAMGRDVFGNPSWTNPVAAPPSSPSGLKVFSDGLGGFIATWADARNGNKDIFAQRMSGSGDGRWPANGGNGVPLTLAANDQDLPGITTDGSNGALVAWQDKRGGQNWDIYGQRVTSAGANRPPTVTAPATASFREGVAGSITVTAADPDGDAIASLTASSSPATTGSSFTANAANTSGTFTWTPAAGSAGTYTVTFTASNSLSGRAATTITVGGPDRPPTVTAPATQSAAEGVAFSFTVSAADPDGDAIASLTSSSSPATSGSSFTANAANTSGTFTWTPAAGSAGTYTVTFTASNSLSGTAATTITVAPPITIQSPNGGESWPPGSQQTIQWTGGTSDPVTIQLFVDGVPSGGSMHGVSTTLATGATGGSYSFVVPDVATTRARVQISQVANGATKYAYSANPFTMATLPPPNTWSYRPVDGVTHGWNQSDMCANGSGGVYAVYLDYLNGGDLRFASRDNYTSSWVPTVAKSGNVGSWPSIVRDGNGVVHIAYYDYTVGGAKLYYTSGNPATSPPSTWPQELVSDIDVVQGDCSIAVDDQNVPYIAFNTGNAGGWKLRVFKRQSDGTWANFGNWYNEDIVWPHHITLKFVGNNQFWVACTDQQTSSRLNLWKYNSLQWVKLDVTNFPPGPYTDVSLALDFLGHPHLVYTVPSNGGQNLIFQPWGGDVMGTPVTVDPTLGTISSVSLQYVSSYPRIGYVGNGVVKQATGVYSATQLPCGWTRQVVDATGNMDSQVSLVVQWNDDRWYLYRNLTTQTMSSAGPYYPSGGGGGNPRRESVKQFSIADEASRPARVVVSGGFGSAPIRFRFEGARKDQPVRVDIFDVRGRLVQTLSGHDTDELTWNRLGRGGDRVASGIVLYRAVAGRHAFTGKMVLTQ